MQPETSRQAHDKVKRRKSEHYKWIMSVIRMSDLPITAGEIAEQVGQWHFDKTAVSRRLSELE